MMHYAYYIKLFKVWLLERPLLNAAMVGDSLSVMSKEFHISAAKFRVVQCAHLL